MSNASLWNRVIWLDREMRAGRYPSKSGVCEEFGVCPNTASSTVRFMRDSLGAPVKSSRSKRGYYYTEPTWSLPAAFVSEGDVLSLLITAQLATQYLGGPFDEQVRRVVERLRKLLPENVLIDLGAFSVHGPPPVKIAPHVLEDLLRATRGQHVAAITHYSPGRDQTLERIVEPHFLCNRTGDWDLGAFDRTSQAFRTFGVRRIEQVRVLDEAFTRRPEIDARRMTEFTLFHDYGDDPFEVVLRFDEEQSRWSRDRVFHASQTRVERPDGTLEIRFRTASRHDLRMLVLSYGSHVEVVEPQWLRDEVREEAGKVLRRYLQ